MKLSQKLLGLAGLAVADYACCPYDDYGIVDPACTLSEKTPFNEDNLGDWNNNMCKAWESNVDATYEGGGSCGFDNWGGCGFQRHFAWGVLDGIAGYGEIQKIEVDASGDGNMDTTKSSAAGAAYTVSGKPFLGGICKLFIPVTSDKITQVSVAGVHVAGEVKSQFNAEITGQNSGGTDDPAVPGTAYCFSVVNIAEFKKNSNGIGNGNVAGNQEGILAPSGENDLFAGLTSLQRQAGVAIGDFGDTVVDQTTTSQGEMVEGGANFDVVAHFHYTACQGEWTGVDMQMTGDSLSGGAVDYPLDPNNAFSHAHTDLQDKRHDRDSLVTDGLYKADPSNTGYLMNNLRWPNFGAWAGFNSVVICANDNSNASEWLHNGAERTVAMSVGSNGFRAAVDTNCNNNWAEYQFNIRQMGTKIEVCGPGELPDTTDKRCTWNWNYSESAAFGPGASTDADPEGFFDRNDNMAFAVWSRKRRAAVGRFDAAPGQPVNAAAQLKTSSFTFQFKDQENDDIASVVIEELSNDGADNTDTIQVNANVVTVTCDPTFSVNSNNQRDIFPSCFTGDEVHLKVNYKPNTVASPYENRGFLSPWFSLVTPDFDV